ncbi:MAG: hypothetical protein ACTSVI_06730 [Promethearchaeota archaeon]
MSEENKEDVVRVFKFSADRGEFIEINEIPEDGIKKILSEEPTSSFAIFQMDKYIVWLYHSRETSTQIKFMSARAITNLRDDVLIGAKVVTVDEGSEPLPFQFVTNMAKPEDYGLDTEMNAESFKPAYAGTKEDEELFIKLSLEKLSLLLEQMPIPVGYVREAVIHGDNIYAVKNVRHRYFGSEIEEIELFPLPKDVSIDSGVYLAEELCPRLLFERNKLVLIELLRKSETKKPDVSFFSPQNKSL